DEVIEKYQVSFDKEEIEKLKKKIINNCSFIKHEEYESDYSPRFTDEIIRNFTYTPIGKEKEYFEETRDIYRYSYDVYKPPYLVELINQLLNGNLKAIDEILNYDISSKSSIDDRINLANQEFNKIVPEDITKKKEKLKELEDLVKARELNKGQQSIDAYYNQLIGLIKFDLVDSLSISELGRIESFLEIDLSSRVEISNSKEKSFVKSL
ncbi:MAG: hypothetical protein IJG68_02105, partial [Bacilli bacterium]|nr:hypothetical protein [Bacilli bacterium]